MLVRNVFPSFNSVKRVHPDPDRLFQQAEALIDGHKDETDLRRAISTAYYGVFHFILRAAADVVVGAANRSTSRYNLAYCSIDHGRLKTLCDQLRTSKLNDKLKPYEPAAGFGPIFDFARLALNLQWQRNLADYDTTYKLDAAGARVAVSDARDAVKHFQAASVEQREAFLTLLLFKPRDR
jgi:hypothetical protein